MPISPQDCAPSWRRAWESQDAIFRGHETVGGSRSRNQGTQRSISSWNKVASLGRTRVWRVERCIGRQLDLNTQSAFSSRLIPVIPFHFIYLGAGSCFVSHKFRILGFVKLSNLRFLVTSANFHFVAGRFFCWSFFDMQENPVSRFFEWHDCLALFVELWLLPTLYSFAMNL